MEIEYKEWQIGVNEKYAQEVLVETTVETAERGGAEKVLSLEAEVKPTSAELLAGEAEIGGKVNYRVLYLDKQGRLCGLDYFKDFKCRVPGEKITPSGKCNVSFEVPDAEARLNDDRMELSCMVEAEIAYYGEQTQKAVASIADAETRSKQYPTQSITVQESVLELEKVAEVGVGVKKIVLFGTEAVQTGVTLQEDGGKMLNGEVRATVVYLNEADEPVELTVNLPFSEKTEGTNAASYDVQVKNARIVLTDDEEGNSVEVEITLVVKQTTWEEKMVTVFDAAIGEKTEIVEGFAETSARLLAGKHCFEQKLTGALPFAEQNLYVVAVRPGSHAIAGTEVSDGKIKIEGVAAFRVIVKGDAGYDSTQGEFPFAFTFDCADAKAGETAEVSMKITDAKATYDGKEIRVEANACFEVVLVREAAVRYLAEASEGAPLPENEAGISVYFAEKGEDVWEIAGSMGVLPSALLAANPFLQEPLTENKKVLIFRKK